MKNDKTFAIKGHIIHSLGLNQLDVRPDSWLVCENGTVAGVFPELPGRYKGIPATDYGDMLVIPGLVDLHLHAPQYAFRGLGMDLELLDWLGANTFPEESKYADLEYADKAYRIFASALAGSATTRACIFGTIHPDATLRLMELLEATGLSAMVGKVNMDRNSPDTLCEASAESSLATTRQWLAASEKFRNISPILTPRFIPTCTDELMRGLAKLQQQTGLPVQSHLSENPSEISWVAELCPDSASYGDAYLRLGLLGGQNCPTIMAHCVYSDKDELELLKEQGVYIAHCPHSNTNLSSGIAPVRTWLDMGLNVGMGTDVAGGHSLSIFDAMSSAIQLSKLRWRAFTEPIRGREGQDAHPAERTRAGGGSLPAPITIPEAFYLATKGGGSFFGKVGAFDEGYEFDAVVLDDTSLPCPYKLTPTERLERIIYLSDDRNVYAKYCGGREVVVK